MNKKIILIIFALIAVLGVAVVIKLSQGNDLTPTDNDSLIQTAEENPAGKLGEGETKITAENFEAEVKNYKGIVMVDMYSPTCPHCQKMGPVVSEIAKEVNGKYKIGKFDVNTNSSIALSQEYKISSVPAFLFFKDGKEVGRLVGEQTKEKLITTLNGIK